MKIGGLDIINCKIGGVQVNEIRFGSVLVWSFSSSPIDPDAQLFITNAVITDVTQQTAINTLVVSLKGYGIWTKMKALYPMIGGTAFSHKFNLKDPRDLDAAYRLFFSGGWVHTSEGILPNGVNAYANTFLIESNTLSANSEHLSIYSRTNAVGLFCDMGTATSSTQSNIYSNYSGGFYTRVQGNSTNHVVNLNTAAMFIANRVVSTEVQGWRNTTKYTLSNNSVGRSTDPFLIANSTLNGVVDVNYSPRQYAFASIGDGLTDTEVTNYYKAVQTFQTTLGRHVGVPIVSDSDAQIFLNAAVIEDITQANAINKLVTDLKGYNIWVKMSAIYPFIGGTVFSHKFNLKDPRDLDAAYRLVFSGGWVHNINGITGNGTNTFADTKLNYTTLNSGHQSLYSRSNVLEATTPYDMGAYNVSWQILSLYTSNNYQTFIGGFNSDSQPRATMLDSSGLFINNRTASNSANLWRNGGKLIQSTQAVSSIPNYSNYIGAVNSSGGAIGVASKNYAFSSIGDGLSDTEAANYYKAVQTFQTTLGRQVGIPSVSDSDAQAFLNAAVITDTTQASAINTLVVSLKGYGVWSKMKAIYPFIGGTAFSHKFNLKNPVDSDTAFRLVFSGGWVHSSTGALPNGVNGFANTFLTLANELGTDKPHISYYSRTNGNTGTDQIDMGSYNNPAYCWISAWYNGSGFNNILARNTSISVLLNGGTTNDSRGLYQTNKILNTSKLQKNNSILDTKTDTTENVNGASIYIGALNNFGSALYFTNRQTAFSSIGSGLTDIEASNYYTAVQIFQTTLGRQVDAPIYSDADANAFIAAAAITDTTQKNAITRLVVDLKAYGVWVKMKALYPMIGGTAFSHKFNLKNPVDSDTAFRLVFSGGWVHSNTGALPNGTNAFANTFLTPIANLSQNSTHISVYSRTDSVSGLDMGTAQSNALYILSRYGNGFYHANNGGETNTGLTAPTTSLGLFVNNRILSTEMSFWQNGIEQTDTTSTAKNSTGLSNFKIYLGAYNFDGTTPSLYSNRQQAFASIGLGLTDTEAANYYTAVQTFQTTLGRQVGVPIVSDSDAQAFLNAAVITDITQANAIDKLVTDLKSYGVWSKMKAIYPFIGGTAFSHKFNLKNPLDTDAAYRLVFSGGWVHSSTGPLANGTNSYANSFLNLQSLNQSNTHISIYQTATISGGGIDIGAFNESVPLGGAFIATQVATGLVRARLFLDALDYNSSDPKGYFVVNTNSTNTKLFVRNILQSTIANSGTFPLTSKNIWIGTLNVNDISVSYPTAGKYTFSSIGDGLTDTEVTNLYTAVQTFQTTLGRQVGVPIVSDSDAQAFLNAAVITDLNQASAINTLVVSLKGYGIWSKMKALYPMIGGTAFSHKFNLKNPLDTDAAFRLVFSGGWVHSSTGALPNGVNGFANTFLIPSTTLTNNNYHLSNYSRTQIITTNSVDIGCAESDGRMIGVTQYYSAINSKAFVAGNYNNIYIYASNTDTLGLQVGTRTSQTLAKMFMDGAQTGVTFITSNPNTLPIRNMYISANNSEGGSGAIEFSTREQAFVSIGDGLSDTEASNLYTAVQIFQTTLGRQVGAPIYSDADANAFIAAAAITNITQQNAIIKLVVDLKIYGIWPKIKALYPFIGGTAFSHKFNLKNPVDSDTAFRLVFNGGWVHSNTGALPNGVNGFADTYLNDRTTLGDSSNSLGFYSRTNNSLSNCNDFGAYDGTYFTGIRFNNDGASSFAHNGQDGQSGANLNFSSLLSSAAFLTQTRTSLNSFKFIRNGVVIASTTATKTGINANQTYYIGATHHPSGPQQWSNREFAFSYLSEGLTDTEATNFYTAVQIFQTTLGRQVGVPIVSDSDAQAFLNAAVITDLTQANAIDKLVTDLKTYGVWSKMKALYPMIGGTAFSHKFNLKNPLDTDTAFRLVFSGGWVHSSTGALPNGTNAFADTFYSPKTNGLQDSAHISYYSRIATAASIAIDMGALSSVPGYYHHMHIRQSGDLMYGLINTGSAVSLSNSVTQGLFIASRITSTTTSLYRSYTKIGTVNSNSDINFPNFKIYIGAGNITNVASQFSNKETAFNSIGDGLTDIEAANYYIAVQTFQTTLGRQVGAPIVSDSDAQAFLNAAEITDVNQANAINTLVTDLKGYGIWTKMKALYPFIGGTAFSHKFNLKNPLDTDAAFRLVFGGGWVHSSTGALPNGTNAFADTKLNENTNLILNNEHISIYSRTNSDGLFCDMGLISGSIESTIFSKYNNTFYPRIQNTNDGISNTISSLGLFVSNRISSTEIRAFQNNVLKQITNNVSSKVNSNIYIGAANWNGSINFYSPRQYAFASIGDGLSDIEVTNYYTAVEKFQTTLGRNVNVPVVSDADAQAFLYATVITNVTQANAVNTLVTDLKGYGIWTKMKAIYPMVGGTAFSHKFNLKNPLDTDAAYRLVFNGGWVHSSTGALPNGVDGFADTKLNLNTMNSINDISYGYYCRTNTQSSGSFGWGVGGSLYNEFWIRYGDGNKYGYLFDSANDGGSSGGDCRGFNAQSRIASNVKYIQKNSLVSTFTSSSTGTLFSRNFIFSQGSQGYENRENAFGFISNGLTNTELSNLYIAVQTFQTTLSRNV